MKKFTSYFIICLLALFSCTEKKSAAMNEAAPEDSAITKTVADAYKVISFKQGETPNYDHIKDPFIPEAQFINFRNDTLEKIGLDSFSNVFKTFITSNKIGSFYEVELFGRTDQFGKIAQRISTYSTYLNTMDSVAERGVNSFQLVKTSAGWKVSSIIWDVERKENPVPKQYLPASGAKE